VETEIGENALGFMSIKTSSVLTIVLIETSFNFKDLGVDDEFEEKGNDEYHVFRKFQVLLFFDVSGLVKIGLLLSGHFCGKGFWSFVFWLIRFLL